MIATCCMCSTDPLILWLVYMVNVQLHIPMTSVVKFCAEISNTFAIKIF